MMTGPNPTLIILQRNVVSGTILVSRIGRAGVLGREVTQRHQPGLERRNFHTRPEPGVRDGVEVMCFLQNSRPKNNLNLKCILPPVV